MQVTNKETSNLIRKQFLIHPDQIKKLNRLTRGGKSSAAEIVRRAIDAYDPEHQSDKDTSDLLELVSLQLKAVIGDTQKTRLRLEQALKQIAAEVEK